MPGPGRAGRPVGLRHQPPRRPHGRPAAAARVLRHLPGAGRRLRTAAPAARRRRRAQPRVPHPPAGRRGGRAVRRPRPHRPGRRRAGGPARGSSASSPPGSPRSPCTPRSTAPSCAPPPRLGLPGGRPRPPGRRSGVAAAVDAVGCDPHRLPAAARRHAVAAGRDRGARHPVPTSGRARRQRRPAPGAPDRHRAPAARPARHDPTTVDSVTFDDRGIGVVRRRGQEPRLLPWESVVAHAVEPWAGGVIPAWWVDPDRQLPDTPAPVPGGPTTTLFAEAGTVERAPPRRGRALISVQTRTGTYRFLRPGGDPSDLAAGSPPSPSATGDRPACRRSPPWPLGPGSCAVPIGPAGRGSGPGWWCCWSCWWSTAVTLILLQSAGVIHLPFLGGGSSSARTATRPSSTGAVRTGQKSARAPPVRAGPGRRRCRPAPGGRAAAAMAPATFIRPCMKATEGSSSPVTTARASTSVRVSVASAPGPARRRLSTSRPPANVGVDATSPSAPRSPRPGPSRSARRPVEAGSSAATSVQPLVGQPRAVTGPGGPPARPANRSSSTTRPAPGARHRAVGVATKASR